MAQMPQTDGLVPVKDGEASSSIEGLASLMERAVSRSLATPATPTGLFTGRIVAFAEDGVPSVECAALATDRAFPSASLVALDRSCLGRRVALMCADGDRERPVIMGLLAIDPASHAEAGVAPAVRIDGKSVTLSATDEIVLQCGKASIVLTRSGKVLIRGSYVSNRSTGVNRIKGGAVQIN